MLSQEAKEIRQGFESFLKSKLPLGGDTAKYARNLDAKIKSFYENKLQQDFDSLYEIKDVNDVFQIKKDITSHPGLVYQRGRSGDARITGLDYYIDFLNAGRQNAPVRTSTRTLKRSTVEMEGKHITREQTIIQRNRKARDLCVKYYECTCAACGMSMKEKYGALGDGVIEVHHKNPIHFYDDNHPVDYKTDLVALCPNCHTMIHKLEDPADIEGLKQLINENWSH